MGYLIISFDEAKFYENMTKLVSKQTKRPSSLAEVQLEAKSVRATPATNAQAMESVFYGPSSSWSSCNSKTPLQAAHRLLQVGPSKEKPWALPFVQA